MTDPTVTDLRRELEKARRTLDSTHRYLAAQAEVTAALHCTDVIMRMPLHTQVITTIASIEHALTRTEGGS
ncbi:hypothetical protein ABZ419_11300 [Streptomyces cinnamoneus]|uniref:hypothetical protein n=1 Tax=Streptomyces cinnamoneus TaxID=53446 RepID=UPI0033F304E0